MREFGSISHSRFPILFAKTIRLFQPYQSRIIIGDGAIAISGSMKKVLITVIQALPIETIED